MFVTFALAAALSPDASYGYSAHASKLHEDLLVGYVKAAPPTSHRRVQYSKAGTDVMLQLRFYKALSVQSTTGQMDAKVWWRMWWSDLRLAWDPAQYGGITEVGFDAAGRSFPQDSEIWLPDVQPYNAVQGLMHSLDPAMAIVTYDGNVSWSRPGILRVMCRFSGLISFPYGELSCPIEVGGWRLGGRLQGLTSADGSVSTNSGCVEFDETEETSLPAYQEVAFSRVECSEHLYAYALADDPYPVIKYRVFITRSSGYYTLTSLVPSMLFTLHE